jgi:hypothetical protein
MTTIEAESSIALQPTNAMTIVERSMSIQSVSHPKDVLNGALVAVKRMMVASERSIVRRMAMMSSITSYSIAVTENAPKRRLTIQTTTTDKLIAHH